MRYGHVLWRVAVLGLVFAFGTVPAFPVLAQEPSEALPSPLTPEAINALVSRLSDSEVRDLLLRELSARAEAAPDATAAPKRTRIDAVTDTLSMVTRQIARSMAEAPEYSAAMFGAIGGYFASLGRSGTFQLFLMLAVALGVGALVDRLYAHRQASGASAGVPAPSEVPAFPGSVPFLARRLLRDAGGAILALVAAIAILGLLLPERETQVGTAVVVWLFFFPRFAWIVLRFFLSPHRADLRLLTTDDWTARVLMRNLVGLTVVIGLFETLLRMTQAIGADEGAQRAGFWVNVVVFVWLAAIFVICRNGLRRIVRGRNEGLTRAEQWVVFAYPGYGVAVIALTWFAGAIAPAIGKEEVVRNGHHFLSMGLLLVAPLCDTLIRSAVHLLVPPMRGSGPVAAAAYESAWRSYVRIARVVVFGATILILAGLWDVPLFGRGGGAAGSPSSGRFAVSLLILAVGFVVLEITSLMINRKLANEKSEEVTADATEVDEGPVGGGAVSRLGTILPPVNWALQAAIVAVTVLTALGHLGVNVTALLAGAGVVGIAVGFGAQKLVADVVSGVFFLVDDAFRLNEYINTGSVEGTVEKIALRSMLLRQSDGAIHCIPYSNISSVTNLGRDWGTMKQVFTVPFDTDIDKVRKIFKKIGQELYDDPQYAEAFIQPFKYKGVSQVNDVGIVVRGKFMFKPEKAKQFLINREIYKRVQADFAKAGIQFARREVRVSVDQKGAPLSDKAVQSIAAAAGASEAAAIAATAAAKPKPAT
jgi:small-conductance mechanosensitive channel